MSSTILIAVDPGKKLEQHREFLNSWGSAPVIWGFICERYLQKEGHWWVSAGPERLKKLWAAWQSPEIPECVRAVHLWTMDRMYVERKDYQRMAEHIDAFLAICTGWNGVNHWPAISELLKSDPDIPAFGLWCTTVVNNPFSGAWDDEKEDYTPFDWSTAYSVYGEIDGLAAGKENV